jgi:hypothetical protein
MGRGTKERRRGEEGKGGEGDTGREEGIGPPNV